MAARTSERGIVVPVLDMEREKAAAVKGEVKTYRMSPEELEDYRARTGYKAAGVGHVQLDVGTRLLENNEQKQKGTNRKEPPKEDFLKMIASGKSIAAAERDLKLKVNSLYYWLKKWDLIGITPGRARELLGDRFSEIPSSEKESADMSASRPGEQPLLREKEISKSEPVRDEVSEARERELTRLRSDNNELRQEMLEKEREIASLVDQLDALRYKADEPQTTMKKSTLPETSVEPMLSIQLPMIPRASRSEHLALLNKEFESISAKAKPRNRRETGADLMKLMQAFVGYIYLELADLVVEENAIPALVQDFFAKINKDQLEQTERQADAGEQA